MIDNKERKGHSIATRLTRQHYRLLQQICDREGKEQAEVLRETLELFFEIKQNRSVEYLNAKIQKKQAEIKLIEIDATVKIKEKENEIRDITEIKKKIGVHSDMKGGR